MKHRNPGPVALLLTLALLLSLPGDLAFASAKTVPMTPELAAKRENFRKQNEQRITPEKRTAAVEALKAERLRVYKAKQAVRNSQPKKFDHK
jgi:hypothetical protein